MTDKETDPKTEAVDQRACSVRCPACGVLLKPDVNVPELIAAKRKALRMFGKLEKGYMDLYTRHQQLRKMNRIMFWCCVSLFACFVFVAIMWVKS